MKLLNYTTTYFALILLVVMPLWAALFYFNLLDEIYDSIDDGLDNQKQLILQKAAVDTSILKQSDFGESGYIIRQIPLDKAVHHFDAYIDTLMYMQNEDEFEPVRVLKTVFSQDNRFYELHVFTSMVEEDDLIAQLLYSVIWLYIGLIITILILNNVLLRRIWRPFYQLLKRLKGFRLENTKPLETSNTNIVEFSLLNKTVQKMLQSNIDTFNNQKQFLENASHELQTPLAISMNKLERFMNSGQFDERHLSMLQEIMESLLRMQRLNQALLLLSKIENQQFAGLAEVNIKALAKKIIDEFSDLATFKNITVKYIEEAACVIIMNSDLATILISNLVKNAIVHNHPGGVVDVTIRKDELIIRNTGVSEQLDKGKIFSRFYKQHQSATSTGLGLAIAKAITGLYGFTISYSYDDKHVIRVYFSNNDPS